MSDHGGAFLRRPVTWVAQSVLSPSHRCSLAGLGAKLSGAAFARPCHPPVGCLQTRWHTAGCASGALVSGHGVFFRALAVQGDGDCEGILALWNF